MKLKVGIVFILAMLLMATTVDGAYLVSATATKVSSSTASVTFQGGPDISSVSYWTVTLDGVNRGNFEPHVGTSVTLYGPATTGRVVVTALFRDGTTQTILDTSLGSLTEHSFFTPTPTTPTPTLTIRRSEIPTSLPTTPIPTTPTPTITSTATPTQTVCSIGWKCEDNYTVAYQKSDCSWISEQSPCRYGCDNGVCIEAQSQTPTTAKYEVNISGVNVSELKKQPAFEAIFAVVGFLVVAYFIKRWK